MTAATTCSTRPGASASAAASARSSASTPAPSATRAPRSTPAPIGPLSDRIVAAGRIRLGTIIGADRDDIAPSRRFYAGGGGSVRGYGYQRLGPRDADGDPIGGRSLAEFALEARIRLKAFGGNFGIVPFFDGGTLSTKSMPDFARLAVRGRHRLALLFQLRADPHRRRHAAQSAVGRQPGRGRRLARPGLLMAEAAVQDGAGAGPPLKIRPHWSRRLVGELATLLVALMILLEHRPGPARHGARAPLAGRPHRPGRDRDRRSGSASAASKARSSARAGCATSRCSTSSGVFLTSPEITLDWSPAAWLTNRLTIDRLEADRVRLERLPKLRPTGRRARSCPSSTSASASWRSAGWSWRRRSPARPRSGACRAAPTSASGRAMVRARRRAGGRRPAAGQARRRAGRQPLRHRRARDGSGRRAAARFVRIEAAAAAGHRRRRHVEDAGAGHAAMDLSGRPTARLALAADNGRYRLTGKLAPAPFLKGRLQRLTEPLIDVRGSATFESRQLDGELRVASPSLRAVGRGRIDLGDRRLSQAAPRRRPAAAAGLVQEHDRHATCGWCGRSTGRSGAPITPTG